MEHSRYARIFEIAIPRVRRTARFARLTYYVLAVMQAVTVGVTTLLHAQDPESVVFGLGHDRGAAVGLALGIWSVVCTALLAVLPLNAVYERATVALVVMQRLLLTRAPLTPEMLDSVLTVETSMCFKSYLIVDPRALAAIRTASVAPAAPPPQPERRAVWRVSSGRVA